MTKLRALVGAAARVVAATTTASASVNASVGASRARQQTSQAVVNVSGNNTVISFSGSISGIAALQSVASVGTLTYGGQGVAVCSINGVGNPAVQGQCLGEQSGQYWSYWRATPGAGGFSYSGSGAGATSVSHGWVEGWNFATSPPPFTSFCDVAGCAPPPPTTSSSPPPPPTTKATPRPTGGGDTSPQGTTAPGSSPSTSTTAESGKDGKDGDNVAANQQSGGNSGGASSGASSNADSNGGDAQAAGLPGSSTDGGSSGAGSPLGVLTSTFVAAGLGGGAWWLRRSRRARAPVPG